jgi:hypothetical protein
MRKAGTAIIIVIVIIVIGVGIGLSYNNQINNKGNGVGMNLQPPKTPKNYQVNMTEAVGVTSSP